MAEERQRKADERDEQAAEVGGALDVDQLRVAAENDRDVTDEMHGDANGNRVDAAEAFDSAERRERFASSRGHRRSYDDRGRPSPAIHARQ
ncbi:hypothetical protein [Leifsonia aquatica]|uniref:hypothetical protein n=1 Tax=Leifsonia aquatica TaxID=144185 RepID=UPI0028ACB56E|nr:hypothetical protein [Leifsonia aquatica]